MDYCVTRTNIEVQGILSLFCAILTSNCTKKVVEHNISEFSVSQTKQLQQRLSGICYCTFLDLINLGTLISFNELLLYRVNLLDILLEP